MEQPWSVKNYQYHKNSMVTDNHIEKYRQFNRKPCILQMAPPSRAHQNKYETLKATVHYNYVSLQ